MRIDSRWRTAGFVAGALFIGTVIGAPLAQAASNALGLVKIVGGGSSHVAKVSGSGRLSVDAGLPMTSADQLRVAEASPASLVVKFSYTNCAPGGFYKVPPGKALIITAANFFNGETTPGNSATLGLAAGTSAKPCTKLLAANATADLAESQNQVFPTGIPVPAGDAVGLIAVGSGGSVEIYGYLVPASAVPHNVLSMTPAAGPSRLSLVHP